MFLLLLQDYFCTVSLFEFHTGVGSGKRWYPNSKGGLPYNIPLKTIVTAPVPLERQNSYHS